MNKVCKSVWNESLGAWVAVSEQGPARGKRSGRAVKALAASLFAVIAMDAFASATLDGGVVTPNGSGQDNGLALGSGSNANSDYGVGLGAGAIAAGVGDVAIGADAKVNSGAPTGDGGQLGSVAVGSNAKANGASTAAFGARANASAAQATSIGAHSTASGTASFAAGYTAAASGATSTAIGAAAASGGTDSIAIGHVVKSTKDDSVSIGSQITNDAASAIVIGSNGSTLDAASTQTVLLAPNTGSVTNSANSFAFNPYGGTGTTNSNDSINLGGTANGAAGGVALGSKATVSAANAVALGAGSVASAANTVSVGSASQQRTITYVQAGNLSASSTDAINGSQLFATNQNVAQTATQVQTVASMLGGGAAVNPDGSVTAPAYNANGGTQSTVGDAVAALDSGLQDRVKYDSSAHDAVTLGNAGTPVTLNNVKAGSLNAESTDAVNGSQLNDTNQNLATTNTNLATLSGVAVKYDSTAHDSVTLGNAGTAVALGNVKAGALNASSTDAINGSQLYDTNQNLATTNSNLATTNTNLATLSGEAVKYDTAAHDKVTFGNVGTPVALSNVKAAALSATSTDAVNGAQLYDTNANLATTNANVATTNSNVATLSGLAVKYDTAAHDSITFGNAGTPVKLTNVKDATLSSTSSDAVNGAQLYATNQKVAQNTADINTLSTNFNGLTNNIDNGQVGIVRQDLTTRVITVGGATNGTTINVAGTAGPRVVTGVANGAVNAKSVDAINGSQLFNASSTIAAALGGGAGVDAKGGVSAPTYNVGGTQVHNVGAAIDNLDGRVTKNTTDIAALQGNLASVSDVASNAVAYDSKDHTKVTLGGPTPADGTAPDAVQLTNVKDGELSTASTDAVNGRQLNATNAKLDAYAGLVNNFQSAGVDYVAVNSSKEPLPVATGTNAVAIGANSTASGNNAVALGANSVADQDNTVSVGSAGNQRRVTNVAPGTSGTDAANVNQLNALRNDLGASMTSLQRSAFAGVAAAMAMPNLTPREAGKTVVAAGVGNYKGYSAFGAGATYRSRDGAWLVNGALSVTPHGDTGLRAQVGYEF